MEKEENYEELEGLRILIDDPDIFKDPFWAKVVGCDRDIGLSIVFDDPSINVTAEIGRQLLCIHGKSSQHRKGYEESFPNYNENYDNAFDVLVKEIKEGVITSDLYLLLNTAPPEINPIDQMLQDLGLPSRKRSGLSCSFE